MLVLKEECVLAVGLVVGVKDLVTWFCASENHKERGGGIRREMLGGSFPPPPPPLRAEL